MPIAEAGEFFVGPAPGLVLWIVMIFLLVPAAGVVTGLKGRWIWLVVGVVTGGLLWIVSAFLPAAPDSPWARRRARRQLTE